MSTKNVVIHGHPCAGDARKQRERIEQAIARGLTPAQVADRLDVPVEVVHEVWDAMDEACEARIGEQGALSGGGS